MGSDRKDSENDQACIMPCGTNASNNITFTEEISPIGETMMEASQPPKDSQYEDFEFLSKPESKKSTNKLISEKENKLSVLLNEYKDRIEANKSLLKSRSSSH